MKKKAQSILEYVTLIGIIAAALAAMQIYFQRGIQATVKAAADEIGSQKKGAMEYDYKLDWKIKGSAQTTSSSVGTSATNRMVKGAVAYGKDDTTTQNGILSWGIFQKKE